MSVRSVPPTRSGLVRASAQLGRVQKGRELLNRKREALITELFKSARPALNARQEVEERASEAYRALLHALAAHGQASLETYAWPGREITVELEHRQIWGIAVPSVVSHSPIQRTLTARETAAPSVGPAAAQTATEFERLVDLVLEALPKEQLVRRLGDALRQSHSAGQHTTASCGADADRRAERLEANARSERASATSARDFATRASTPQDRLTLRRYALWNDARLSTVASVLDLHVETFTRDGVDILRDIRWAGEARGALGGARRQRCRQELAPFHRRGLRMAEPRSRRGFG